MIRNYSSRNVTPTSCFIFPAVLPDVIFSQHGQSWLILSLTANETRSKVVRLCCQYIDSNVIDMISTDVYELKNSVLKAFRYLSSVAWLSTNVNLFFFKLIYHLCQEHSEPQVFAVIKE